MSLSCLSRATVVVAALLLPALTAGAAQAAWSLTTPDGPVSATVAAAPSATAALYPGASVALSFTVHNTGSAPVAYTAARFAAVVSDDGAACPAAYVSVLPEAAVDVVAASGSTVVTVPGAVTMRADAPDGCQGRTFSILTTLSGPAA